MSVKSELTDVSVEVKEAVNAAEQALTQLVDAAQQALAELETRVLATTIGDAIAAGQAALAKLRS